MTAGGRHVSVLDSRALNRALLARQHLLVRASMPAESMVEGLVGMQAQNPLDPYVALWSRLDGFRPTELATLILERRAVRVGFLRTTLHLVTAHDALALWPVMRPVLERAWAGIAFRRQLRGVDIDEVLAAAQAALKTKPRTTSAVGRLLHDRWPDHDAASLGYAARFLLPIAQIPPRGVWGMSGQATWAMLDAWLGQPLPTDATPDETVCRYLAAFGPASAADIRTWSRLTGLREVVERLRPGLVTYRDEAGRELFDLPDAPRPDQDTPAPPRFLPAFDNVLLSHDDRTRVIPDVAVGRLTGFDGSFLVDGFVRGEWRIERSRAEPILAVESFEPLTDAEAAELAEEAARLLEFMSPEASDRRIELRIARERDPSDTRGGIGGTRRTRARTHEPAP